MLSLTELAHRECGAGQADIVIDATAGNGHDTLFLAERVGPFGKVYAFDIQAAALDCTAARLAAAGITNVRLIHDDHANMLQAIDPQHHGRISTVMFNLGYLPGSDKTIVTKIASTLAAIDAAIKLLRDSGTLTILAYPGHPGGIEETVAVEHAIRERSPHLSAKRFTGKAGAKFSPQLLVLTKQQILSPYARDTQ